MLQFVRPGTPPRIARFVPVWEDLDEVHDAVWQALRPLFPRNAMVDQTDYGSLLVSWELQGSRRKGTHFAAPVMIRIGPGLLVALWTCDGEDRHDIAQHQVETVRDALAAYDPHSRIPSCGVIQLGD